VFAQEVHATAASVGGGQAGEGEGVEDDGGKEKKPVSDMKGREYSRKLKSKLKRPGPPPEKPKYKPWDKVVTKDHEKLDGLITIYRHREGVLYELSEDDLDKPMLAIMTISKGIGSHLVYGGLSGVAMDDVMFDFHRVEDHVQIRRLGAMFRAPGDTNLQQTIDLTFSESILASFPIKTEKDGKIVIDVTKYYLSDTSAMSMFLNAVFNQPARLDPKKGYYASIRNYPDNIEIDVRVTYSPTRPAQLYLPNVPDQRYVQVGIRYSINRLPEEPMMPRIGDDRIGYFMATHKDFTRVGDGSFFVHYINRWRLEKSNPDAAVSEPKKPIVYYVDRTVPEKYVPYVMKGIERWQTAFEKAGFKNAIVAKRAPTPEEDPEYDPADARYNTIRWNVSDQPLYTAIGPSHVDPRTGEIIDADILLEHNLVLIREKLWRRYVAPREALMAIDPSLKEYWQTDEEKAAGKSITAHPYFVDKTSGLCEIGAGMQFNGQLQWLSMVANGIVSVDGAGYEEYIGEFLAFVTAHEVGHTLGLRHNFKSSVATPVDRLNDKAFVEKHGMTGSVMDYPSVNVAVDPSKQGYYYSPSLGSYDMWAIQWGYKPANGDDVWEQSEQLQGILKRSSEPALAYGTDWDTYPAHALDPRVNIWDLGGDPVEWARERIAICDGLLLDRNLEERVVADGDNYAALRGAVVTLFLTKYSASQIAVKNIGGQYAEAAHRGDDALPLQPVPSEEQRRALEFVIANALDADRFMLSPDLLNKLADDKMPTWQNFLYQPGRRYDFPLSLWVGYIQNAALTGLMSTHRQARVVEAEYKVSEPFRLNELYGSLTKVIWMDKLTPSGRAAGMDRNLQRIYTQKLIIQVTTPFPGTPQEAIALSRLHLQRIRSATNTTLQKGNLGDDAQAHMIETIARIDRALESSRISNF
jgi:hypothetical protein